MINITIIPALSDNYVYLLEADNGEVAVVDPGEAGPVIEALDEKNLTLDYILSTHHHYDHIGGNTDLIGKYSAKLVGPAKEEARIPNMDIMLHEGDHLVFGSEEIEVLETPGHTRGHICYYLPETGAVFTGDTLFLMSTGRLFEGTPKQMWGSLQKIAALPDETEVYCAHEYTLDNGEFCLSVEPDNAALQKRMEKVRALRADGKPTMPGNIGEEKETNAFLRARSAQRYGEIRGLKDAT